MLLPTLLTAVSGCASLSHVARPGYECTIPPESVDAESYLQIFHAHAVLDADGRQVRSELRWGRIHRDRAWNIFISASRDDETSLTTDDAYASIEARWPSRDELRLQLTANPDSPDQFFESSPTYYGHASLSVTWSELLMLSRRTPSLTLLVRSNGKVVERWSIESALIEAATRDIDEGLGALAERTVDYRNQCDATDDIDPEMIFVT